MTFAVGMRVRAGLVALADTRVLRGHDRSKKSKLAVVEHDHMQFFVATSGLRSVSDKTQRRFEDELATRSSPLMRIHDVASAYGEQLRRVRDEDRAALLESGLAFNSHAIIGGRLAGDLEPELFLVYPEGNWVMATHDAPYMVIGRSTYGKPTLDLLLHADTPVLEAAALAYLAFDATRRCSVDVDFPIDLIVMDRAGVLRARRCVAADLEPASAYWLTQQQLALTHFPVHLLDPLLPETHAFMTIINVHSQVRYTVHRPSTFLFTVLAAHNAHQTVLDEKITVSPELPIKRLAVAPGQHEIIRVAVEPGPFSISYDARVELDVHAPAEAPTHEVAFGELPVDVLAFLNPSRYCESDRLARFAERQFGRLDPGFERVAGICNWIYDHLEYVAGSTDSSTTAVDVLVQAAGVCRDFAHLGIALCRASGIPARYVSGYAVDLDPPDFHGFFEVYLDHRWFLCDATRMAPLDRLVRIAEGRDAADAAFATSVGAATLDGTVVSAIEQDGGSPEPAEPRVAVSTTEPQRSTS